MKKWKCASIVPLDRCTRADEQYTSPAVTKKAATRRFLATRAKARQASGTATSSAECRAPKPCAQPEGEQRRHV